MSRLQTQVGLSGTPGIPAGVGGINPGSFTPVVDTRAVDLLNLVKQATQVVGTVRAEQQRLEEENLADAYESTRANLIRQQQEAVRDPSKEGVFLASYHAASDTFRGTRFEADIASFGEGTVTQFQQRAERKAQDIARGFLTTKVMPAVSDSLTEAEVRDTFLSEMNPGLRRQALEGLIYSKMPANLPDYFQGEEGQRKLEEFVVSKAQAYNDVFQAEIEKNLESQERDKQVLALNGGINDFISGDTDFDSLMSLGERNNYSRFQVERSLSESIAGAITATQYSDNAGIELQGIMSQAQDALGQVQDQTVRASIANSIATGKAILGRWASDGFVAEWQATFNQTGNVDEANLAVVKAAYDLLGIDPEGETTIDSITRRGFEGPYNEAVAQAAKNAMQRVQEISNTQKKIMSFGQPGTGAGVDVDNLPSANIIDYPEAAFTGLENMSGVPAERWSALYASNPEQFWGEAGLVEMRSAASLNQTKGVNKLYPVLMDRLQSNGPEFFWGLNALQSMGSSELNAMFVGKNSDEILAIQDIMARVGTVPDEDLRRVFADRLASYRQRDELETARLSTESDFKDRRDSYNKAIKNTYKSFYKIKGQSVDYVDSLLTSRVAAYSQRFISGGVNRPEAVRMAIAQMQNEGYVLYVDGSGALSSAYDPEGFLPESHGVARKELLTKMKDKPTTGYAAVIADRIIPESRDLNKAIARTAVQQGYVRADREQEFLDTVVNKGYVTLSFDAMDRQETSLGLRAFVSYVDRNNQLISYELDLVDSDGLNVYRGAADSEFFKIEDKAVLRKILRNQSYMTKIAREIRVTTNTDLSSSLYQSLEAENKR